MGEKLTKSRNFTRFLIEKLALFPRIRRWRWNFSANKVAVRMREPCEYQTSRSSAHCVATIGVGDGGQKGHVPPPLKFGKNIFREILT